MRHVSPGLHSPPLQHAPPPVPQVPMGPVVPHWQAPKLRPSAAHTCTPRPPPTQSQLSARPGTHEFGVVVPVLGGHAASVVTAASIHASSHARLPFTSPRPPAHCSLRFTVLCLLVAARTATAVSVSVSVPWRVRTRVERRRTATAGFRRTHA